MAADEQTRVFDFARTVQLARLIAVGCFVAWLSTAVWAPTEHPRWLVLLAAVGIAVGALVYGRRAWARLVRRATLDDRRLQVVTASGAEHVIERDDITVRGLGLFANDTAVARLHFPGGTLYVLRPAGAELAARLRDPV